MKIFPLIFIAFALPFGLSAHPGAVDAKGYHTDESGGHYHRGAAQAPETEEAPAKSGILPPSRKIELPSDEEPAEAETAPALRKGVDGKFEIPPEKFSIALATAMRTGNGPKDVRVQLVNRKTGANLFAKIGETVGPWTLTEFTIDRVTLETDQYRTVLYEGKNLPVAKPSVDLRAQQAQARATQQRQSSSRQSTGSRRYYQPRAVPQPRAIGGERTFKNRRISGRIGEGTTGPR